MPIRLTQAKENAVCSKLLEQVLLSVLSLFGPIVRPRLVRQSAGAQGLKSSAHFAVFVLCRSIFVRVPQRVGHRCQTARHIT